MRHARRDVPWTSIPKSSLSRRIAALERQLGVRLVQRSSHAFHLTDVGERVYRHARAMADEADAVQATVSESLAEPSGLIRVSSSLLQGELFLAACAQGVGVSRRSQASGAHRVAIRRKGVVFTAWPV